MTADEQRTIGRLEAEIESLQKQMARQEAQNVQIMTDLREIRETLVSAKGQWKGALAIAGLAGTIGAVAAKIIPFSQFLPK
jgi:chromosome segregation ATPase